MLWSNFSHFVSTDTFEAELGKHQPSNRLIYVNNRSIRFTIPCGHIICVDKIRTTHYRRSIN